MPGTLQLSRLSEGTLSFRYPIPISASIHLSELEGYCPFSGLLGSCDNIAPSLLQPQLSDRAEPLVARALPNIKQNPGLAEDHAVREHLIPQKAGFQICKNKLELLLRLPDAMTPVSTEWDMT